MKLADAIDRVRASTVQISVELHPTPTTIQSVTLGSGFIVNADGWVVTARHVIDAATSAIGGAAHGGDLRVGYAGPNLDDPAMQIRAAFVGRPGQVTAEDPTNDLALIRLPGDVASMFGGIHVGPSNVKGVDPKPIALSTSRPREGVPVAISGYPLGEPSLVTTSGHIAVPWAFENLQAGKHADRFLADITANPGNSGGPAYSPETLNLLGVCVAARNVPIQGAPMLAAPAGLTVLVPSAAVGAFLDKNGVTWLDGDAPAKAPRAKRRRG